MWWPIFRTHAHAHVRAHLNELMPVLYGLAWIGQHGGPVLPAGTVGVAAHTTHPDDLVVADADAQRRTDGAEILKEEEKGGGERDIKNKTKQREKEGQSW